MFKTPKECYDYIVKNELETAVIGAMMQQTDNYSIAEIADARFHNREGKKFPLLPQDTKLISK